MSLEAYLSENAKYPGSVFIIDDFVADLQRIFLTNVSTEHKKLIEDAFPYLLIHLDGLDYKLRLQETEYPEYGKALEDGIKRECQQYETEEL